MLPVSQIPKVIDPPIDVFHQYFVAHRAPVVIVESDVFSGGPTTFQDLAERRGQMEVNVRLGNYADFKERRYEKIPITEFVNNHIGHANTVAEAHLNGKSLPVYSANTPLSDEDFEQLGLSHPMDLRHKRYELRMPNLQPRMWLGPAGSLTPLHFDSRDNMVCQYIGRKHFVLFPPSEIKWLYTHGVGPTWSRVVNPLEPDLEKYPRFANAKRVEVTLHPGEILYLPMRWSHFVVNLDNTMMVNFWPGYTLGLFGKKAISSLSRRVKERVGIS